MQPSGYRPDIDGLRAVAVLPVVLFHAGVRRFAGGFVGVDVFFVISGFLIARLLLHDIGAGQFSLVRFYERRARRILPALLVLCVASFVGAWFVLLPSDFRQFGHSLLAQSFFAQNFLFWHESGYFDLPAASKPLLHTWTLGVEEQFYILFPVALYLAMRLPRRLGALVLFAAMAASLALSVNDVRHPSAAFYLLPTRAWELLLGASLNFAPAWPRNDAPHARSPLGHALSSLGIACIAASVFLYDQATPFPGFAALLPCAGAALVIWANQRWTTWVGSWLSLRPIVLIGLISYSLYLWHVPILVLWKYGRGGSLHPWQATVAIAASVILAWLSWKFIEMPVRRGTLLTERRDLFVGAALGLAFVGSLGAVTHVASGFPSRIPGGQHYAEGPSDRHIGWKCRYKRSKNILDQLCPIGDPASIEEAKFLVVGDSHADAIAPALKTEASKFGVSGYYIWAAVCPPIVGVYRNDWPDCPELSSAVLDLVRSKRIEHVILISRWGNSISGGLHEVGAVASSRPSAELFAKYFAQTVDTLTRLGAHVWVVGDVPIFDFAVPQRLVSGLLHHGDPHSVGITFAEHVRAQAFAVSVFQHSSGATLEYVDPAPLLCEPGEFCRVESDGWSNYRDESHLSIHGALQVAPAFDDMFKRFAGTP